MKAIDIRYNKDIVGNKASATVKYRLSYDHELDTPSKIKNMLAVNGHPSELSDQFKGRAHDTSECCGNCRECWNQKVK